MRGITFAQCRYLNTLAQKCRVDGAGWLFWRPETVKLIETLQPRCFIRTEQKLKPYIETSPDVWGEELMELVKKVGK